MEIEFRDERYICNKTGSGVIISSISDLIVAVKSVDQNLLFYPIDCSHKKNCGIIQLLKGKEYINWQVWVHPELNGYGRLKN